MTRRYAVGRRDPAGKTLAMTPLAHPASGAQDRADHAREILKVDLPQITFRVAAPEQLGGESGEVLPASHAGKGELAETAAGIPGGDLLGRAHGHDLVVEVTADAHVVDADELDDVVDVIGPAGDRRLAFRDVAGDRHHADQTAGRR